MSLIEVLISSLLLAGSSAAALGVWSLAATEVAASRRLEQQGDQLERLRLASHRWLIAEAAAHTPANGSCRFDLGSLRAAIDRAVPAPEGLVRRLSVDPQHLGVWLELEATAPEGRLVPQRRQLLTPAAYGLCQP